MSQARYRRMSLGAVASIARSQGRAVKNVSAEDALAILDDLARVERHLLVVEWYLAASSNQLALFRREWRKYCRRQC